MSYQLGAITTSIPGISKAFDDAGIVNYRSEPSSTDGITQVLHLQVKDGQILYPERPHTRIPGSSDTLPPGFEEIPPAYGTDPESAAAGGNGSEISILERQVFGIKFSYALIGLIAAFFVLSR